MSEQTNFIEKEDVVVKIDKPQSQVLSGPQESSSHGFVEKPWSGRLQMQVTPPSTGNVSRKGKEKVGETPFMANVLSKLSHVDVDLDRSKQSLD